MCVITTTIRLQNSFITQNTASCHFFPVTIPCPQRYSSWHSLICHYILIILRCCKNGVIKSLMFGDWIHPLSLMPLRSREFAPSCSTAEWHSIPSYGWIHHVLSSHFLKSNPRLDYFWFEAIINKAILDFYLHVSVFTILTSGAYQFFFKFFLLLRIPNLVNLGLFNLHGV